IFDAQEQLNHHARSEDVDLRNSSEPGAVAENPAALPIYPLPRTRAESKYCRDGGNSLRHSDFLDFRANYRSGSPCNSLSSFKSTHERNVRCLDISGCADRSA